MLQCQSIAPPHELFFSYCLKSLEFKQRHMYKYMYIYTYFTEGGLSSRVVQEPGDLAEFGSSSFKKLSCLRPRFAERVLSCGLAVGFLFIYESRLTDSQTVLRLLTGLGLFRLLDDLQPGHAISELTRKHTQCSSRGTFITS